VNRCLRLSAILAVAAFVSVAGAGEAAAEWLKTYEIDWTQGSGGWSAAKSSLPGKRSPRFIAIDDPLMPAVIYFNGQCGWAIRSGGVPPAPIMIVSRVYMLGSQRNALSVNVRNRGGGLIYKYGMGGGNYVVANCQGAADQPVNLAGLQYQLRVPYDLMSRCDGRGFYVGLKNLLTGDEVWSPRRNNLKGGGPVACIDIDQEGGYGPAALGKVEVWLDR